MALENGVAALKVADSGDDVNKTKQYDDNIGSIELFNDEQRLKATKDLLYSLKTTKPLTQKELDAFKLGFIHNIRVQNPANRIEFLTIARTTLQRVKASYSLEKRKKTLGDLEQIYTTFIDWLVRECLLNLYPTAYFGQKTICLQVLRECVELFLIPKNSFCTRKSFSDRDGKYVLNTLQICLLDTFEENKREALYLLTTMKRMDICTVDLDDLTEASHLLSVSVNPADSLTTRYLSRLIVNISGDEQSMNKNVFTEIRNLTDDTTRAVEEAKRDIISGAVHNPIHTRIATLRGLISEIDFKAAVKSDDKEQWSVLIADVLTVCLDACKVVQAIVCNDSPEGHLPMDCAPVSSEFIKKMSNSINTNPVPEAKRLGVTTQMLLIFGWKTIKEAAHLFAELISLQPTISHDTESGPAMVTCAQVMTLLDFYENSLLEIKHRGAFEQAFYAFSSFVPKVRALKCSHADFPNQLLYKILDGISIPETNSNEVDSKRTRQFQMIFRRSAGLPLIIQAILQSHVRLHITGEVYKETMVRLLLIANDDKVETWQLIHTLNIIRGICRDTKLGPHTEPFLENIFRLSISSFKNKNYSVRNSSCMLFSSLMKRTFGQPQPKNPKKAITMSTRQFFTTFPNLYRYLIEEIENCLLHDGIENPNSSSPLYQVMLMFTRLFASSSDVVDVSVFIPLFKSVCVRCPHFRVRHLASRAFAQLASVEAKVCFANELSEVFIGSATNNEVQGMLLLVEHLALLSPADELSKIASQLSIFSRKSLANFLPLLENAKHFPFVAFSSILTTVDSLMVRNCLSDRKSTLDHIVTITSSLLDAAEKADITAYGVDAEEAFIKGLTLSVAHGDIAVQISMISRVLGCTEFLYTNIKLAILRQIKSALLEKSSVASDDLEEFFCYDYPFNDLHSMKVLNVADLLKQDTFVSDLLLHGKGHASDLQVVSSVSFLTGYFACREQCPEDPTGVASELVIYLIKENSSLEEETKASAVLATTPLIEASLRSVSTGDNSSPVSNLVRTWCDLIYENFSPEADFVTRKAVACVLRQTLSSLFSINRMIVNQGKGHLFQGLVKFSELLIRLLHDDEPEIREIASVTCSRLVNSGTLLASQVALKSFAGFLVQYFTSMGKLSLLIECFSRFLLEDNEVLTEDDEDRLFDKNKLNIFDDVVLRNEVLAEALSEGSLAALDEETVKNLATLLFKELPQNVESYETFIELILNCSEGWISSLRENSSTRNICLNSNYFYGELNLVNKLNYARILCRKVSKEQNPTMSRVCSAIESILKSDVVLSPYAHKVLYEFHLNMQ